MKMLLAGVALAALLASPAVGQTRQPRDHVEPARKQAQSAPVRRSQVQRHAQSRPCVGYTWRGCLGWDPDPRVRMMLRNDANLDDE
jgi:hypothetical protein